MAHTTISGNLGKTPELKADRNGRPMCRLSVAWSERTKDIQGTWVDGPTVWVSVTTTGPLAEHVAASFNKGERVNATGNLRPETWSSNNGEETVMTMFAEEVSPSLKFGITQFQQAQQGSQQQQGGRQAQQPAQPQQQPTQGGYGGFTGGNWN